VNDRHNTCGQAYALTVMTAILEGHESGLTRYLSTLKAGPASPLANVPGTHFARWVVIGDVVHEGIGQRDHLRVGRLLFTSNFDGPFEAYLEKLRTGLGRVADAIWSHCSGYPGAADAGAFASYMRSHQLESSLFFAAYGERTVDDVKRSLALRRQIIAFAVQAQRLPPVDLQAAFRKAFA